MKDENNKHNYAHFVRKHKEMLSKTSSTNISGFPIPNHNFPTPLGPHDRDYDYHQFIDELNITIGKLNSLRVNLFDDLNEELPEITTLSAMKLLIQNESIPRFLRELRGVALLQSDNPNETLYPDCRAGPVLSGSENDILKKNTRSKKKKKKKSAIEKKKTIVHVQADRRTKI